MIKTPSIAINVINVINAINHKCGSPMLFIRFMLFMAFIPFMPFILNIYIKRDRPISFCGEYWKVERNDHKKKCPVSTINTIKAGASTWIFLSIFITISAIIISKNIRN